VNRQLSAVAGWWWMVFVLLGVALLAVPGLDADALWYDEVKTYQHAGGAHYGPRSPGAVWAALYENAPDQAPGYFVLLNLWARAVGWSEFAVRALSLLAGLLAVAVVYRAGRDFFGGVGGYAAALLLGANAYYIHFLHEARAFGLGMLATAVAIWAYWYLMKVRLSWRVAVLFALGALGMLYSHYFIALSLLALALYHLLLGPETGRWWLPVGLAVPVTLAFTPALLMLQGGIAKNTENARLQALAMNPPAILWEMLRYFGNGLPLAAALLLGLGVLFVLQDVRRSERYVAFVAIAAVLLVLFVNSSVPVLMPGRERYLAGLWVLLALLATATVMAVWRLQHWAAIGFIAAWVVCGGVVTVTDQVVTMDGKSVVAWREMVGQISDELAPTDVLAFHAPLFPWGTRVPFEFYKAPLPIRAELVETLEVEPVMQSYVESADRVWLGVDQRYPSEAQYDTFRGVLAADFTVCEEWQWAAITSLSLYARSEVYCPTDSALAQFGGHVMLANHTPVQVGDDGIGVSVQWNRVPGSLGEPYSVGFQLMSGGELVAQQDIGLPPHLTFISHAALAPNEVSTGTYQLNVVVYNWQTGGLLPLATEETVYTLEVIDVVTD
jgi:hypothetical protein